MSDLPFGLESQKTYAQLSPADLQSLGKRASVAYLGGEMSLNDAIIKLAREYPSISPHQVKRVVEFANQETFSKLFSDNEKYASDKNIEFDVADPGDVLLELNNGARPSVMSVPPDEYSCEPVKMAHSTVEADLELSRVFGVDMALPGSEMTVKYAQRADGKFDVLERIFAPEQPDNALDRLTKHANLVDGVAAQPAPAPQQAAPSPQQQMQQMAGGQPGTTRAEENGTTHNDQMLELQREIELAKKRQELQKVEQQTIDQMNPGGAPGAVPAPPPPMPGGAPGMQGPAPDAGAAAAPQGAPQGGPPPEQMPPAPPPEASGALMAPPGGEGLKMGSALVKQAMAHIKSGRPHSDLLIKAASAATSLDRIKKATVHRGEYAHANPWGEVIRSKQKLAKLLEDATHARGKTVELYKEATERFENMLFQELRNGMNFGEAGHLLAAVDGNHLKTVLASAVTTLIPRGFDPVKARAEAIQYEMEKGASARVPNLNHPLADAYASLCKLANALPVLETARTQLRERYDLVDKALQGAMLNASSR